MGATFTINPTKVKDLVKAVQEVNYGRSADYVIECVAGIEILRQAFQLSARNGTTVVVGHGHGEQMKDWTPVEFCGGKILTGSAMGAIHLRIEIPRIIELYKAGRYKLDEPYPAIIRSINAEAMRTWNRATRYAT